MPPKGLVCQTTDREKTEKSNKKAKTNGKLTFVKNTQ